MVLNFEYDVVRVYSTNKFLERVNFFVCTFILCICEINENFVAHVFHWISLYSFLWYFFLSCRRYLTTEFIILVNTSASLNFCLVYHKREKESLFFTLKRMEFRWMIWCFGQQTIFSYSSLHFTSQFNFAPVHVRHSLYHNTYSSSALYRSMRA